MRTSTNELCKTAALMRTSTKQCCKTAVLVRINTAFGKLFWDDLVSRFSNSYIFYAPGYTSRKLWVGSQTANDFEKNGIFSIKSMASR